MKMVEIKTAYVENRYEQNEKEKDLQDKIDFRRQQISRLEKRLSKHYETMYSWTDVILKPIADAMTKHLPDYNDPEILGPFGVTAETSIHFYRKGIDKKDLFFKWDRQLPVNHI